MDKPNGKIKIKLPNGYFLVAEQNTDPSFRNEIYVGITDGNGVWWQDLAVVRPAYKLRQKQLGLENEIEWSNDKFEVMVYSDAGDEDYTHKFDIGLWHGGI